MTLAMMSALAWSHVANAFGMYCRHYTARHNTGQATVRRKRILDPALYLSDCIAIQFSPSAELVAMVSSVRMGVWRVGPHTLANAWSIKVSSFPKVVYLSISLVPVDCGWVIVSSQSLCTVLSTP